MLKNIPLSKITLPPYDLRFYRSKEAFSLFCSDIEKSGMLVKPIVRETNGKYEVLDGWNRLRCAKKLGWKTVLCDVLTGETDEVSRIIIGLKVNMFRFSHDVIGVAQAFQRLRKLGLKQIQISRIFGFSKGHVSKLLSLNKLPPDKKLEVAKGQLNIEQAYQLVRKKRNPELMEKLNIKYKCGVCGSKVDLSQCEIINLCFDCRSDLEKLIRDRKEKMEREKGQRWL